MAKIGTIRIEWDGWTSALKMGLINTIHPKFETVNTQFITTNALSGYNFRKYDTKDTGVLTQFPMYGGYSSLPDIWTLPNVYNNNDIFDLSKIIARFVFVDLASGWSDIIVYYNDGTKDTYIRVPYNATGTRLEFDVYESTSQFSLTLNATNQQQISVNGVNYNTFPQTLTISGDTTITATGNPNRTITLQNEQNVKQVQIGSTIYNNFPVSIPIPADTIIRISGKDDPQITVDYTHTTVPIITNI